MKSIRLKLGDECYEQVCCRLYHNKKIRKINSKSPKIGQMINLLDFYIYELSRDIRYEVGIKMKIGG